MSYARNWHLPYVATNVGSSTIVRVVVGEPDPNYRPRPAGFTVEPPEHVEPLLWEGDQA